MAPEDEWVYMNAVSASRTASRRIPTAALRPPATDEAFMREHSRSGSG